MEKQHGVYCSEREWLGVMAAIARGMLSLQKDAEAGDVDAAKLFPWANTGCIAFHKRVMEELGVQEIFKAWTAGDAEKAKELGDKYADGIRARQR